MPDWHWGQPDPVYRASLSSQLGGLGPEGDLSFGVAALASHETIRLADAIDLCTSINRTCLTKVRSANI